jgi:hypothetical protein
MVTQALKMSQKKKVLRTIVVPLPFLQQTVK